jgi:molecular chaperone DnaK (HSP70)
VTDSVVAVATPLVPAVDSQIRRCANIAGLQVLRIYASAVMASICRYLGLLHEGRILVFDFGGRFCNAAVVDTEDDVWEVRSVETGRHTCGNYIDRSLAAHLAIEFRKNKESG